MKTWSNKSFNTNNLLQSQKRLEAIRKRTKDRAKIRIQNFILSIPKILSGDIPADTQNRKRIFNAFWSAVILSIFTDIHKGYEAKSLKLNDENGDRWQDLSPFTKAYKRNRKGFLTKSQRGKLNNPSTIGLLTPAQYDTWKKNFKKYYGKAIKKGSEEGEAKEIGAKFAWTIAKNRGAETLIGTLGEADMLIMRATNTLFNSLRPGKVSGTGKYRKSNMHQIAKFEDGGVVLGTNVPYAKMAEGPEEYHRPIWPEELGIWYDRAIEAGRDAMAQELKLIKV